MQCPICESPSGEPALAGTDRMHGIPGSFRVAVCRKCGAGWTLPRMSTADLAAFYPDSYHAYRLPGGVVGGLLRSFQCLRWRRLLGRPPLRALTESPPGRLLDVGCGRGDLGAALIQRGWQVAGVEPSPEACVVARGRGVQALVGTLQSQECAPGAFDAVTMNHSLEHVVDPRADLERVFALLRPGGLLLVALPNFACWERQRFGPAWFHLDLPRHRTHFTPQALRLALQATGFEILNIGSSADSGSLLATLQISVRRATAAARRDWHLGRVRPLICPRAADLEPRPALRRSPDPLGDRAATASRLTGSAVNNSRSRSPADH